MQFYKVDMDENNINRLQWLFSIFRTWREKRGTMNRREEQRKQSYKTLELS